MIKLKDLLNEASTKGNVLFTDKREYEKYKDWVKNDLKGEVDWDDFVIKDYGYDSKTGNYYLAFDMKKFVKLFGWGEVRDPEFDMTFA